MYSPQPRSNTTFRCIRGIVGGIQDGCRSFCMQTSIHGFNHIAAPKRHWLERLLWVCVVSMAVWGVVDISVGQLQRYRENPTVVTLEKDFRSWNYTMLAVTACNQNRTNPDKLEKAIASRWNVTPENKEYDYYSAFVDVVVNSDLYNLWDYERFKNDPKLDVDLFELVIELMPEPRVKLSVSDQITTLPRWIPVMTEVGACHAVNSAAVADVAVVKPTANDTVGVPITCEYSPQGCYYILEYSGRIDYYVHSAFDIADILTTPYTSFPSLNSFPELSTTETGAGPGVRALPPGRRHCLYTDEPVEPDRQVHSSNICRQDCKSRLAVNLCGCKPFYYFYTAGPPCGPAGMWCLAHLAHRLGTFDNVKCACVQQCVDSVFRELTSGWHLWQAGPLVHQGVVRLSVPPPRMRYTRYIVFHFQDLVVSFGGATGLYLGASFISFVEIGYFFIERISRIGRNRKEEKRNYERKNTHDKKNLII